MANTLFLLSIMVVFFGPLCMIETKPQGIPNIDKPIQQMMVTLGQEAKKILPGLNDLNLFGLDLPGSKVEISGN